MTLMSVNNPNEQGKDSRSQPRWSAGKKTDAVLRLLRLPKCLASSQRYWGPSGSSAWPPRPGSASTPPPDPQLLQAQPDRHCGVSQAHRPRRLLV